MKFNLKEFEQIKELKLPHSKINYVIWRLFDLEHINKEQRDFLLEQLILLDEKLFKWMQNYENNEDLNNLLSNICSLDISNN